MGQGGAAWETDLTSPVPSLPMPAPLMYEGREAPAASWKLEPTEKDAPAWYLALWKVEPYDELQAEGLPLPPTPAEVAALPVSQRLHEQLALKKVWLQRLIRAREERNRVSRENMAQSALLAHKLGTPAAFADMLSLQASGKLSPRARHLVDDALQSTLAAYGVDARELRYFVEACDLSPEQLRDVVAWLPLPTLFNSMPAVGSSVTSARLSSDFAAELAARQEVTVAFRSIHDRASADAAAAALLPALACHMSALPTLLAASNAQRVTVLAPYARYASPVESEWMHERERVQGHVFYGSHRLQALDYFLH